MKEYSENFITKDGEYCVSVRTQKDKVVLGIDICIDGFYADLTKKEIDELITMLKNARKKIMTS